jgi:hypothetical protein
MKTPVKSSGPQASTTSPCECLPCDIPAFCRTGYYMGKLLTARDFTEEQRYHVDHRRLHNLALHGWGTVCGLKVKPHPHCPSLRIVVEPGLALDGCGREVRLLEEVELILPRPVEPPRPKDPCPPDPSTEEPGLEADAEYGHHPPHEHSESLWVCLRYCERPEQFSPAPFDECACTGTAQKPNAICESYCLELTTKEPSCLQEIEEHKRCDCDDCAELYESQLEECEPVRCDCIPLAVIRRYEPGCVVTAEMIDNWRHRPLLPSVHRLDQIVRCLLEKMPRCKLTHISDINWTHGSDLRCHDFLHRFIGHDRGFDIRFDGDVRPEGINRRTFQAMVVHHPGRPDQAQRTEIAPAHVEVLSPTHIRLRIDEAYARGFLDRHNFDLLITLKCNVIVDHSGTPVDGDLLARLESDGSAYFVDTPTGNGVPGGLFESWVRVHGGEGRHEAP